MFKIEYLISQADTSLLATIGLGQLYIFGKMWAKETSPESFK